MNFEQELVIHLPSLRRYAYALTGSQQNAEDLVQDCLARAWEKLHLWQIGSNLRTWLFTIMHNLYINQCKKKKPTVSIEDIDEIADNYSSPEQQIYVEDLQKALHQLPFDQKEVLLMVALEGMQYSEVAKILNVPIGTVMSRLHRARERLRLWLEKEQFLGLRSIK